MKRVVQVINNEEWLKLKTFLLEKSKEHDEVTGFTPTNLGLSLIIEMCIEFYEYGRGNTLPPNWKDAYEILKKRDNVDFQNYLHLKERLKLLETQFEDLDSLDLNELTGGPMREFLNKKKNKKK
jgi:hypothetical protein